ncbi:uncharacterized protein LOC129568973 [Sitodiplosis mosellana]|uniref:uncharacterized protein LOC129568973 n=1 Tax=Sitodiplosis mosellana TaxID=263140 RepID=UPI00244453B8|nr:uncharacterized protein LOC129568973 [Sitodiplosis mosellana]
MGNTASKKGSVILKTPEKSVAAMTIDQSPTTNDSHKANQMVEPQTPAIPQTPLTQTIASHLNRITKDDVNRNATIKTPSYLLRKKILYDLGYTYSIKDTDPRSPSLSIPRTPLNLAENSPLVTEGQTSSFEYNTTLEDSCRDFNAKLDDITMEENVLTKGTEHEDDVSDQIESAGDAEEKFDDKPASEDKKKESVELHDQKTPNCDSQTSPDFESKHNNKIISASDASETDSTSKASEENISPMEGMYSTPLNKSNRVGRIPLSVINRRGMSAEIMPLHSKHTHEQNSVDSFKKDLSFNDIRGSARKSKIPVFKK